MINWIKNKVEDIRLKEFLRFGMEKFKFVQVIPNKSGNEVKVMVFSNTEDYKLIEGKDDRRKKGKD